MLGVPVAAKALLCQADLASLLEAVPGAGETVVPWLPPWAPQGWWEAERQGDVVSPCPLCSSSFSPLCCVAQALGDFQDLAQLPRYLVFASFSFHNLANFFITAVDFNLNY